MKNLLHTFKRTPFLHMSIMLSMKLLSTMAAMFVLFVSAVAFAQEPATNGALDDPTVYLNIIFDAVKNKSWGAVAAAVLVMFVALFRTFGKKLHDMIPDTSPLDKPFYFLLETKVGGWILNTVTAMAAGFGGALLAHQTIDFALVRTVVGVSLSAAGIWGAAKDLMDHYGKATPPDAAAAAAAGAVAAKAPGDQLNK